MYVASFSILLFAVNIRPCFQLLWSVHSWMFVYEMVDVREYTCESVRLASPLGFMYWYWTRTSVKETRKHVINFFHGVRLLLIVIQNLFRFLRKKISKFTPWIKQAVVCVCYANDNELITRCWIVVFLLQNDVADRLFTMNERLMLNAKYYDRVIVEKRIKCWSIQQRIVRNREKVHWMKAIVFLSTQSNGAGNNIQKSRHCALDAVK
jgi:hypothetical protein